jgi:hypothetical protein
VAYKTLREPSPLTEIHLAWRKDDRLPALQLFIELAAHPRRAKAPALRE